MKKLVVALTAMAAFTGSALAADLGARPYTKAPAPVTPVYNWTGFYIFGGAGGGVWDSQDYSRDTLTGIPISKTNRSGGDGWFGTVGIGYDWQFGGRWVAGVFADGQFGSLKGSIIQADFANTGDIKLRTSAAAGVRLGYLVAPNVLSYVNGGYAYSEWSGSSLSDIQVAGVTPTVTNGFNRNGWFIGGGVENSFDFFGINAPGWFMKTEYRAAEYQRKDVLVLNPDATLFGTSISTRPIVQTVSTSLVYRFNWGGAPIGTGY
jgi:outer membrane immunogenic protein